jgi:hypothetical protein
VFPAARGDGLKDDPLNEEITRVQSLHLQLIECIERNAFEGQRVADGLRHHSALWVSVIAGHSRQPHPALHLFDELPEDTWHPDELWIMAINLEAAQKLITLCRDEWQADEAEFFTSQQAMAVIGTDLIDDEVLVRAWWD